MSGTIEIQKISIVDAVLDKDILEEGRKMLFQSNASAYIIPKEMEDNMDRNTMLVKKAGKTKDKLTIGPNQYDAVFFHKPEEPDGYLSNWYPSPFDLEGVHYTSVEQYIMYQKCKLFGDEVSAAAVLVTEDVAAQQAIGRKAKGYVGAVWSGVRQMVAFQGLMAKFSQNEDLKQKLLDTQDAFLVECAGSDKIWACGIRLTDERRFDVVNWDGENILGFALMEVRSRLRGSTGL